ncbi:MAG: hypothetical protein GX054_01185 [Clostridiales bacterium]|nr:hypothetical protein [Clostridiales bacterium]
MTCDGKWICGEIFQWPVRNTSKRSAGNNLAEMGPIRQLPDVFWKISEQTIFLKYK